VSSPSTKLIRGGKTVDSQNISVQDILIRGEKIEAAGHWEGIEPDVEIDARGLYVFPGAVDTHVHFNDLFMNTVSVHDFDSGTRAAAFGGVTSIIDFANQRPGGTLQTAMENKKDEADGLAVVDWGIHPVITDPTPAALSEIPQLVEEGAPTFKCYMTYKQEGLLIEDEDLKRILESLTQAGGMLLVHAEDNATVEKGVRDSIRAGNTAPLFHARSRPLEAENIAIERCIQLARETNGRLFIVHMATDRGLDLVSRAREGGLQVYAETCTHYLILTEQMLNRPDGIKWICSPPLRNLRVQQKLWQGLRDRQISLVSSDDAAYSWEAKSMGASRFDRCPNGIPGIEARLCLLFSEGVAKERITLPMLIDIVSTQPAKLFGLYPHKGSLDPGADADLVLFDPEKRWIMGEKTLHMAADWSAYEGMEITGRIEKVFSRGDLIIDGDRCLAQKGRGRYLHRRLRP